MVNGMMDAAARGLEIEAREKANIRKKEQSGKPSQDVDYPAHGRRQLGILGLIKAAKMSKHGPKHSRTKS